MQNLLRSICFRHLECFRNHRDIVLAHHQMICSNHMKLFILLDELKDVSILSILYQESDYAEKVHITGSSGLVCTRRLYLLRLLEYDGRKLINWQSSGNMFTIGNSYLRCKRVLKFCSSRINLLKIPLLFFWSWHIIVEPNLYSLTEIECASTVYNIRGTGIHRRSASIVPLVAVVSANASFAGRSHGSH